MSSNAARANADIVVNGRRITVAANCTVAVALLNVGITSFRESVSGESRGPVCGMGVCFECRVTIDNRPHQRACLIPVADGMEIRTADAS
jgi:aerobic-type carbon monoxide dehydrogenase small subunit (CoxS/CutS family)